MPSLRVRDLAVSFDMVNGSIDAVRGVSFDLVAGEILGVVGESGCGKSVTARALLGLVDHPGRIVRGSVEFRGRDILSMSGDVLRDTRGREISMIFQDPVTSLNPVLTVFQHLRDVTRAHGLSIDRNQAEELLRDVEIAAPAKRLDQYPHELSGGMRQRAMIAMALANDPEIIIADEPTTSLDVTTQAQILDLLRRINAARAASIILISHSLDVIGDVSDRVAVFYAGKIVEIGDTKDVFQTPAHPYTKALMASRPMSDDASTPRLRGTPPHLSPPPVGCAFAERCPDKVAACESQPSLEPVGTGHEAACWLWSSPHNSVAASEIS